MPRLFAQKIQWPMVVQIVQILASAFISKQKSSKDMLLVFYPPSSLTLNDLI